MRQKIAHATHVECVGAMAASGRAWKKRERGKWSSRLDERSVNDAGGGIARECNAAIHAKRIKASQRPLRYRRFDAARPSRQALV